METFKIEVTGSGDVDLVIENLRNFGLTCRIIKFGRKINSDHEATALLSYLEHGSDFIWTSSKIREYLIEKSCDNLTVKGLGAALHLAGFERVSTRINGQPVYAWKLNLIETEQEKFDRLRLDLNFVNRFGIKPSDFESLIEYKEATRQSAIILTN